MKQKLIRILCVAATAGAILGTLSSLQAAETERREHKDLPAQSGGTLTFKSCVGGIEVRTHEGATVAYDAVVKPGGGHDDSRAAKLMELLEFDYASSDGNVTITLKWKDDHQPGNVNLNAHHTLLIPTHYSIDVRTSGGGIRAEDIGGRVTARTSGGGIHAGNIDGSVDAQTSGGGITVADVHGDAHVQTSGGGIKVGMVSGELEGTTSGGSIDASLASQIQKPLVLKTSGGSIRLTVPADFKGNLHASTSGGRVKCSLPFQGKFNDQSVSAKINGGGPEVTLRTSGGNIDVAER